MSRSRKNSSHKKWKFKTKESESKKSKSRKKTPVRNSDRAVVKRPARSVRNQNGERRRPPKASKSPIRPTLVLENSRFENPKTPKKLKRWEKLYNMANSKSKETSKMRSKTPRKHVELSKEKDKYHYPRTVRTPRGGKKSAKSCAYSRENSSEQIRPFHMAVPPKSPNMKKRHLRSKRKSSGFKYDINKDRSTKKKSHSKKGKFRDLFKHGTYECTNTDDVMFRNSNSK